MPRRKKLYCGDADELPSGYTDFGTPSQCLRKGYGAALVYSTEDQRKKAVQNMVSKGPRKINRTSLRQLALSIGVDVYRPNSTTYKRKRDLLPAVIRALRDQL